MGPMSEPIVNIVKLTEIFPSYHQTKPIVSIKKTIDLEYMTITLHIFCSAPSPKRNEDYILY